MAIIFLNQSECTICNQTLNKGEDIVSFPPMLKDNKFYIFNDSGFHHACLEKFSLGREALKYLKELYLSKNN
ncbi:hypothetical protein [Chryseobacterium sp. RLHN22]|uniref:hypothetical protein n=1 Tax=Chryseobacterium sp. RLHN22 TaxID=3437885 RepID=UPI003D9BEDCD